MASNHFTFKVFFDGKIIYALFVKLFLSAICLYYTFVFKLHLTRKFIQKMISSKFQTIQNFILYGLLVQRPIKEMDFKVEIFNLTIAKQAFTFLTYT